MPSNKYYEDIETLDGTLEQTREVRERLLIDKNTGEVVNTSNMTAEQLTDMYKKEDARSLSSAFTKIFSKVINHEDTQQYIVDNKASILDFIFINGQSLEKYFGKEKYDALKKSDYGKSILKAEVMRALTDPKTIVGYASTKVDEASNTVSLDLDNIEYIVDPKLSKKAAKQSKKYANLKNFKEYKLAQLKNGNVSTNLSDANYMELYAGELRMLAIDGFIPDDRIISHKKLLEECDPQLPSEAGIKVVDTIFGAKPVFITEFSGEADGTNGIYSDTSFKFYENDLDSGSFDNHEFAILAYLSACNRDAIKDEPITGVKDEDISPEMRMMIKANMWTSDVRQKGVGFPRISFAENHYRGYIQPAREATVGFITEYDKKNIDGLANNMTKGIKLILRCVVVSMDFWDPNGDVAFNLQVLDNIKPILEKRPDLKAKVMDSLSDQEKEELEVLGKLHEVFKKAQIAKGKLAKHDSNEQQLSPQEREACLLDVANFAYYSNLWAEANEAFQTSPGYLLNVGNVSNLMKEAKKANDASKYQKANFLSQIYQFENEKLAPEIVEAMKHPEVNVNPGADMAAALNEFENYFYSQFNVFLKVVDAEKNKTINSSNILQHQRDKASCQYKLKEFLKLFGRAVPTQNASAINDLYKKIAKAKGLPDISILLYDSADTKFSKIEFTAEKVEGLKEFFGIVFKEMHSNPRNFKGLSGLTTTIKTPVERSFEERVELPKEIKTQINNLKKGANEEDKATLDEVAKSLSVLTDEAHKYLSSTENCVYAMEHLSEEGMAAEGAYKNGAYEGILDEHYLIKSSKLLTYKTVKTDKADALNDFYENGFTPFNEETRVKLCNIMDKMKSYGLKSESGRLEESNNKIYGHQKIIFAREDLRKAVESGKMEEIRAAKTRFDEESAHISEVFTMLKESFADGLAPGNVDTARNQNVPPAVSSDIITDSRMSGLAQILGLCDELKITPDEYTKNPGKYIMQFVKNKVNKIKIEEVTKNSTNYMQAFDAIFQKGDDIEMGEESEIFGGIHSQMAVNRLLDPLIVVEPDAAKRLQLQKYKGILSDQIKAMIMREAAFTESIKYYGQNFSTISPEEQKEFSDGMKQAFISNMITKEHLPVIMTNPNGVVIDKHYKFDETLKISNLYQAFIDAYNNNKTSFMDKNITYSLSREFAQEAMFDYLMAHPEGIGTKPYKDLENLALNFDKNLKLNKTKNSLVDKYKKYISNFSKEKKDLEDALQKKDNELNKKLAQYRKDVIKWAGKDDYYDRVKALKPKADFVKAIDDRIVELMDAYHNQEVTASYLKTRYDQLVEMKNKMNNVSFDDYNKLKDDLGFEFKKAPDLLDKSSPEKYDADVRMVAARAKLELGTGHLASLDAYKKWVKEKNALSDERLNELKVKYAEFNLTDEQIRDIHAVDYTEEEWEALYRQAAAVENEKRPLPEGVVDPTIKTEEDYLNAEKLRAIESYNELGEMVASSMASYDNNRTLIKESFGHDEKKAEAIRTFEERVNNLAGKNVLGDQERNDLITSIAAVLSYNIFEKRGKKVPGSLSAEAFVADLARDKSFKEVVDPLVTALFEEKKNGGPQNGEKSTYEAINEMIEDGSILSVTVEQQKHNKRLADEAKKKQTAHNQIIRNDGPKNAQQESKAVTRAKQHLQNKKNEPKRGM